MIVHLMNEKYESICGAKGSWTGTRKKHDVTCPRCQDIITKKPADKAKLKQGLFIPRDPSRTGSNAS